MEKILNWLTAGFTHPVRDPVWKHIYFPEEFLPIIRGPSFLKLQEIKQLGPAYLVYPGATHTRYNHSLGVCHLAKKMIPGLLGPGTRATLEGVKAFLLAALLHDLGHYPFAHALKDLQVKKHEKLTGEIILAGKLKEQIRAIGTDPLLVAAIIDQEIPYKGEEVGFFRNILSGVLDPDKLDYLNRDAYFAGVPYGVQDIDYVISQIIPHKKKGVAIIKEGLATIENILFSKYLMYKTVYWHKKVRIATAMIKKAVLMGLTTGFISAENLYGLGDLDFKTLSLALPGGKKQFTPFNLIGRVFSHRLHKQSLVLPFDKTSAKHQNLEDPGTRLAIERELAVRFSQIAGKKINEEEVIIDVPERISFEVDIPVRDDTGGFVDYSSSSALGQTVVTGLVKSLRTVSLILQAENPVLKLIKDENPEIHKVLNLFF